MIAASTDHHSAHMQGRALYRLPWTAANNPSGWVEVTTHCQLRCPGCYRGTGQPGWEPAHRSLPEVQAEIDRLCRSRNIQALSISGGEPLLYPDLDDVIRHARSRYLEVLILSNGVGLDTNRLRQLRDLGVARILLHIERNQQRDDLVVGEDLNALRSRYCDMFRGVDGVTLGFMFSLSPENMPDLPAAIEFYKQNMDVVHAAGFTVRGEPRPGLPARKGCLQDNDRIFEQIRVLYGLEYGAYLPRTRSNSKAWLFAFALAKPGAPPVWLDANACRAIQEEHMRATGRYMILSNGLDWSFRWPLIIARNPGLRRLALPLGPAFFRGRLKSHVVFVINTPVQDEDGRWDVCDGCPDAMLWDGKLIPSCLLQKAQAGEPIPILGRSET